MDFGRPLFLLSMGFVFHVKLSFFWRNFGNKKNGGEKVDWPWRLALFLFHVKHGLTVLWLIRIPHNSQVFHKNCGICESFRRAQN